jgi:hypothetical protein
MHGADRRDVRIEGKSTRHCLARYSSMFVRGSDVLDCERTVISQSRNLEEHRGLRTHTAWQLQKAKSLIACALTLFEVA